MEIEHTSGLFTVDAAVRRLHAKPAVTLERLGERLWTVSDGCARALFAEGHTGVIAFDTLGTPGAALAFRETVGATLPGRSIHTVVYTHDHLDAAGWAGALAPGAEIIAHEATAKLVELRRSSGQSLVSRSVGANENMCVDGVEVALRYPGPTHGTGNLAVLFPAERLLFMSGTALPNARYGFFPDYHIGSYARSMRRILALDFVRFVPGRYEVGTRDTFETGIEYFEAMDKACQEAYVDPKVFVWVMDMVAAYVAERLRPRFGQLEGFDEELRYGAFRIVHHYLMGGWGLEDTPAEGWALFNPGDSHLVADPQSLPTPAGVTREA
jgi:glyoxylase-like metal-dependent hydrolase (beta-lactamase superfamily II)